MTSDSLPPAGGPARPPENASASTLGAPAGEPGVSPSALQNRPGGQLRVLIVDDDEPIRKLLARVAGRYGFTSVLCSDGAQAIEEFRAQEGVPFDLILLDLMMPGVNGFEFLEFLKEHDSGALSRVVVLTASPKVEDHRISREPVRAVIQKPFNIEELSTYLK